DEQCGRFIVGQWSSGWYTLVDQGVGVMLPCERARTDERVQFGVEQDDGQALAGYVQPMGSERFTQLGPGVGSTAFERPPDRVLTGLEEAFVDTVVAVPRGRTAPDSAMREGLKPPQVAA